VAAALRAAGDVEFDLVISDVGLPDGTGWELMRRLRRRQAVPGIALTGFGRDEDVGRTRAAGFAAHLTKPVDFARLEATIRQVASGGVGPTLAGAAPVPAGAARGVRP
jgi:DNA-binding response OmpR family regulator